MEDLLKPTEIIEFDQEKADLNMQENDWTNKEEDMREGVKTWQQ